ncbi:IMP-specific 5'-nucleotidase 1 [Venturia nashicola]|uniref:IMP-specific 5'-nucleotidase 1 n=1 Tax=Venturia nashicola TaxID=86259 RepID=A0A4Z1P7J4_9PEZI|nr:IMP-specific 5'-nucleotidase 1 [Venturia nashicola]TLD37405.1 IMP-specific 5'-nucleotidase 1 [Venturia nashicola]
MPPNRRKHDNRFASKNLFEVLDVYRHVSWAPLDPDFEAEPLPPTHSFFSSFPGEIRNAIYAHLLDIPKHQEAFGHELILESDDIEKSLLHAVVLHEHARKLPALIDLGVSCKAASEEIFSMIRDMVQKSTTLVVKLDILLTTTFNLTSALQNLARVHSGPMDVLKLVQNSTLRIIWPQDNLECFYLGAPLFFKGLEYVPKCLQMQVPWGPWHTYLNNAKIDYGMGAFIHEGEDALFHRSYPCSFSSSAAASYTSGKDKRLLAWNRKIYNITTFHRTHANHSTPTNEIKQQVEPVFDLGTHLREQCQNHFVRAGTWNRVQRRWDGFLATGDWWEKRDEDARYSVAGKEISEERARERREAWFRSCVVDYGL